MTVPALFYFDNLRVNAERRGTGRRRLRMKKWIGLCLLLISACLTGHAQDVRVIHVDEPGTLAEKIAEIESLNPDETVKITGELYNSDFKAFQKWKGYSFALDLSDAVIDTIPEKSFYGIDLKKILFPISLKRIEAHGFNSCVSLKNVDLSHCVDLVFIGTAAFGGCNFLQRIDVSTCIKLEYLGEYVFSGCTKLESIDLSNNLNLREIKDLSFYSNISLSEIKLPPFIEIIGKEAFAMCKFQYLEIPASIKKIKWHAFVASKLSIIKIDAVEPPLLLTTDDPFMKNDISLIVPMGSKSLYQLAPVWSKLDIREVGLCFIKVKNDGGGFVKIGEQTIQSGEISVPEAKDVQVSFIPDKGYRLIQVKLGTIDVTDQVEGDILTIPQIVENKELAVVFEKEIYSLKVSYNEGGEVKVNEQNITSGSSVPIAVGTDVKLVIIPNEGFKLQQVLLGTDDVTDEVIDGALSIPMISENKDIVVRFEKTEAVTTYSVKVTYHTGGSVKINDKTIPSGSSETVNASTDVTVSIVPNTGYHIKSVKLGEMDVTSQVRGDNTLMIPSVSEDKELTVVFEQTTYIVKVTYNAGGMVKVNNSPIANGAVETVNALTDVQVSMIPNEGYLLKQVKLGEADVTDQIVNHILTISEIAGDREVTVVFEKGTPVTYSLKVSYSDGGTVKVNNLLVGSGTSLAVTKSTKVSVRFVPDEGFVLKQVLLDGVDVTNQLVGNVLEIPTVSADLEIVVFFEEIPMVSCIVNIVGNGVVKVNEQQIKNSLDFVSVEKGEAVTFSFTPDAGYELGKVLMNNREITSQVKNNTYRIAPLISDVTCQVEFVLKEDPTSIDPVPNATKRVYRSAPRRLVLSGFEAGVPVYVYDGSGRLVVLKTIRDSVEVVDVPSDGLYFVRIGKESFKVVL